MKKQKQNKRPEWVTNLADQDQYKLSAAELMQKKISLISKHRFEAKDSWNQVQDKLKHNIVDEETQRIYETALQSKGLSSVKSNRRNLTQMIEWERNEKHTQQSQLSCEQHTKSVIQDDDDSQFISKVKGDLENTKKFIDKAQKSKKPEQVIKAYERLNESKENKENIKKPTTNKSQLVGDSGLKNLNNVITFLEQTLQSQEVQHSKVEDHSIYEEHDYTNKQREYNNMDSNIHIVDELENQKKRVPSQIDIKQHPQFQSIDTTNNHKQTLIINDNPLEQTMERQSTVPQKLNFGNLPCIYMRDDISYDDNIDQLRQMLEQTKHELNQMNLQESCFIDNQQLECSNRSVQFCNSMKQFEIPMEQSLKTVDFRQISRKYRNSDTFNIHDHLI